MWTRSHPIRRALLCLLLMTVAAAARTSDLDDPLWVDELHTAWTVADGPGPVIQRAAQGNQGPVYFWIVWAVQAVFSSADPVLVLRLPSAVAGVALLPVLMFFVYRATGSDLAATMSGLLVAFDRQCLIFSQEARPYAWVQLVSAAQVLILARLLATDSPPPRRLRLTWIVLSVVLFYLHYTSALLLGGEVLAVAMIGRSKYRRRDFARDLAIVVVLCLPATAQLLGIYARRTDWTFVQAGPLRELLTMFRLDLYVLIPTAMALVVLAIRWWVGRRKPPNVSARTMILVGCWWLVPLLAAYALTWADIVRLYFSRYTIVSVAGTLAWTAIVVAAVGGHVRIALAVAVLLVIGWFGGVPRDLAAGQGLIHRNEQWGQAVAMIRRRDPQGRLPVFLCPDLIEDKHLRSSAERDLVEYCLFPLHGPYRLRHSRERLKPLPTHGPLPFSDQELGALRQQGGWFIVRGRRSTANQILRDLRRQLGRRVQVQTTPFGGVTVLQTEVGPIK